MIISDENYQGCPLPIEDLFKYLRPLLMLIVNPSLRQYNLCVSCTTYTLSLQRFCRLFCFIGFLRVIL